MTDQNDLTLIERFNNGDQEAFNLLYERYQTMIKSISIYYFGPSIEKEDLWQEASIGLYIATKKYDPSKGHLNQYVSLHIHSRLKNLIKGAIRKKHRILNDAYSYNNFISEEETMTYEDVIRSSVATPEEILLMKEASYDRPRIYRAFVSKCSVKERTVLRYYLKGYQYKQIAQSTGFSKKSIDNSLMRIKLKIERFNPNELKVI